MLSVAIKVDITFLESGFGYYRAVIDTPMYELFLHFSLQIKGIPRVICTLMEVGVDRAATPTIP